MCLVALLGCILRQLQRCKDQDNNSKELMSKNSIFTWGIKDKENRTKNNFITVTITATKTPAITTSFCEIITRKYSSCSKNSSSNSRNSSLPHVLLPPAPPNCSIFRRTVSVKGEGSYPTLLQEVLVGAGASGRGELMGVCGETRRR